MEKTLFVSDLDGTLLSSDSRLSSASADMLNNAIDNGALFTVATARTPSTVALLMSDVRASLPFIVMTGSALWSPLTGDFFDTITISRESAERIFDIIKRHSLPAFIYCLGKNRIDIYHTGPLSVNEKKFMADRDDSDYKVFHVPGDGNSVIPHPLSDVSLFYSMQPTALVESAYHDIKEHVDCNPIFYHDMFGAETGILEVFSPLASKANAVRRLKEMTGATRVVAFGDNLNDLPMLRVADVAVAVENAVDEVKAAADIIIPPNTTDSVARFILDSTLSNPLSLTPQA
ncbi:MAG: HAD hydrolase family protein [Bacteroides sp.]|nr:HAD hydrolase family protein [Bacteroides sp.]